MITLHHTIRMRKNTRMEYTKINAFIPCNHMAHMQGTRWWVNKHMKRGVGYGRLPHDATKYVYPPPIVNE